MSHKCKGIYISNVIYYFNLCLRMADFVQYPALCSHLLITSFWWYLSSPVLIVN